MFIQSDTCKGDTQVSLNFCEASGLLVIGEAIYGLRLSPLESLVVSYFVDGSKSISHRRRQLDAENEIRLSL